MSSFENLSYFFGFSTCVDQSKYVIFNIIENKFNALEFPRASSSSAFFQSALSFKVDVPS